MRATRPPAHRGRGTVSRLLAAVTSGALTASSGLAGVGLLVGALGTAAVLHAAPASADTAPPDSGTPATVSADALPTVQINGVVWSQVTIGNTVYATGSFTSARPAGSPAGTNETPRKNLLAYDITTGALLTSFSHGLNAQGMVVSASPDGTKLYVGGDFTTVDGIAHNHLAEFNVADGTLVSGFAPAVDARVRALAATASSVYVGGSFTSANGTSRARLAAFAPTNGSLQAWAPTADDSDVWAMVLTPDKSRVVVGGKFKTLSLVKAYGLGALDATTGAVLPWDANKTVRDAGTNSAITSLRTDGTQIYGTGYVFGAGGNLEGTFAANPNTGVVAWVEDCHGDTYDTFATGRVLYKVSHSHYCGNIGAFPQTNPWTFQRALAYTTFPTGTITHDPLGYHDWFGTPAPTQLDWYPTLDSGTFTGQNQAAWSATGNDRYLALGGEFPRVNSTGQQGLVRFAITSLAPNKIAPRPSASLTPTAVSLTAGTARVAWKATFDQDNQALTYKLVRDGNVAAPVFTTTVNSTWWQLPAIGFTDTGLTPGSTHSYRVFVSDRVFSDPLGNVNSGSTVQVTVSSAPATRYVQDVRSAGAVDYWRLGEASGTTAYDWAGYNDLAEQPGVGHGAAGALGGDPDTAATFSGTSTGSAATNAALPAPTGYSVEAWFTTTSSSGGEIVGFGDAATGTSVKADRQVYLDNAGHLVFGTNPGAPRTITSSATYNDGQWHHVVATQSGAGMVLFADGRRVARNTSATTAGTYNGFWRLGGDTLAAWPSPPTSSSLAGTIDEVAVYPSALRLVQVQQHYVDSGRTLTVAPAPTDSYGAAVYADDPDLFWRLDESAGPTAADTSPNGFGGTYGGGASFRAPTPVTGPTGTGVALAGGNALVASQTAVDGPSTYSEELWFATTTRTGGQLIGFGNAATGLSTAHDRQVWMLDTGQLAFGTDTGQHNIATSAASYNDGAWHHVVATQGPDGMHLYVDGNQAATNPASGAASYTGFWRVGGDAVWSGATSGYLTGTVDEVAVYPVELSAAAVLGHYQASPAGANSPPVAAFTSTCPQLTCTFDGSSSRDPGGSVATYAWDFGDGTTSSLAAPSHTYPAAGDYQVTLTVTDNTGAPGSASATVSPRPPANPPATPFATDGFARTVTGGLGTADTGGAWTTVGSATKLAVAGGTASFTMSTPASQVGGYLGAQRTTDAETALTLTTDKAPTGNGVFASVVGRRISLNNEYRARVRISGQAVGVSLTRLAGSATETVVQSELLLPGLTYTPGMALRVRFQVTGTNPTTLRLKVWPAGTAEPATWQLVATDATAALQAAGSVGLTTYLAGNATNAPVVLMLSSLVAGPTAGTPTATFAASCTGQACTVDGSASSDPGGTVSGYQWSWGDGALTTGPTSSHTYGAAGTYRITLTVTNPSGWTDVTTQTVTVPA